MSESFWAPAVQWGAWFVVMSLVMGWLGWSRTRARPNSEMGRLAQPISILILGVICSGFCFALLIVSNLFPNDTVTWWTNAVFAGFGLLSLTMPLAFFIDKHEVNEAGLNYTPTFGLGLRRMDWTQVESIRYAHMLKWFVVKSRRGEVARLSAMLMGLPEFARLALIHAPSDALDEPTKDILRATAAGNPPSVWM